MTYGGRRPRIEQGHIVNNFLFPISDPTDQLLGSERWYIGSEELPDPLVTHDESITLLIYHKPRLHL